MKFLALTLLSISFLSAGLASADNQNIDLKKDFSTLGDNDAVVQRAKALDPKNKYKVVQGRAIDMNMKVEVGCRFIISAAWSLLKLAAVKRITRLLRPRQ